MVQQSHRLLSMTYEPSQHYRMMMRRHGNGNGVLPIEYKLMFQVLLFVTTLLLSSTIRYTTTLVTGFSTTNLPNPSTSYQQHHNCRQLQQQYGIETALYQERKQSSTISTSKRFQYRNIVDTLPSFRRTTSASTATTIPKKSNTPTVSSSSSSVSSRPGITTAMTKKKKQQQQQFFVLQNHNIAMTRILRRKRKQLKKTIWNVSSEMTLILETICNTVTKLVPSIVVPMDRLCDIVMICLTNFWYLLPSLLCFVPLYTMAFWQTIPVTPDVWKLVNMDFIWFYYTQKHHAISVILSFLASNASFFIAALYLLKQSTSGGAESSSTSRSRSLFPSIMKASGSNTATTTPIQIPTTTAAVPLAPSVNKRIPSSLGYWILAAGIMSTIFHTVQACGNYRVAEALCYLDHGIAGTAICHFYNRCGAPSIRTVLCMVVAFVTLAFPITAIHLPAYTMFHSIWHTLAAITAVIWAYDSPHYHFFSRPQQHQLIKTK